MGQYIVGIDAGGTFTDLVCMDIERGNVTNIKIPLTPPRYAESIANALAGLEIPSSEVISIRHGSTVAINTIRQRKGSKVGLITTKGFRDVLEAARADRPDLYNFLWDPGATLVPRRNRLSVTERIDYEGNIVTPIDLDEVREIVHQFKKRDIESIAICFINSYINPLHEKMAKKIVQEMAPDVITYTSHEISPEIKEFERTSTTVASAYLGPVIQQYCKMVNKVIMDWGYHREVEFMHSGGGLMTSCAIMNTPARFINAGVSGTVVFGKKLSELIGMKNILTFDMGGTNTEIGVINDGRPRFQPGYKVEFKIPIQLPCLDIVNIGAGGASIAWIDSGAMLKTGSQSAGAYPGPASYDRGGIDATVTDANVVLGRLSPRVFLGGKMTIKPELAKEAVEKNVASCYGIPAEEAAYGIIKVFNARIVNSIRLFLVQRGFEIKDFTLVAFGGAGPMHAAEVALGLGIQKVIIPRWPGLTSAMGFLFADYKHILQNPIHAKAGNINPELLNNAYGRLENEAKNIFENDGIINESIAYQRFADIRYAPQDKYITVPVPSGRLMESDIENLIMDYHRRHEKEFGYSMPFELVPVEFVNVRLIAASQSVKPVIRNRPLLRVAKSFIKGSRPVYFGGRFVESEVWDREQLAPNFEIEGPAVIEQTDTTIVVPPGIVAVTDSFHNIILNIPINNISYKDYHIF